MFKVKTKEERIREKEEKVKVTNLEIYTDKISDSYTLKGFVATGALCATLFGSSFAWGIGNVRVPALGDTVNEVLATLPKYLAYPITGTSIVAVLGLVCFGIAAKRSECKIDKMERLKYFMENKDAINNGADKEITILDAKHLSWKKLENYKEKGRSKVLR